MSLDTAPAQSNGAASPTPISDDQFTQADPRRLYARMRPDQRTAIAGEFMRLFRLSGDPEAQRYVTPITDMLPPARVAELHTYARQHHPEILEEVCQHPVTQAALATPGKEVEEPLETEEVVVREGDELSAEPRSAQTTESGLMMSDVGIDTLGRSIEEPMDPGVPRLQHEGDTTPAANETPDAADTRAQEDGDSAPRP